MGDSKMPSFPHTSIPAAGGGPVPTLHQLQCSREKGPFASSGKHSRVDPTDMGMGEPAMRL